jgi:hypothetical protein
MSERRGEMGLGACIVVIMELGSFLAKNHLGHKSKSGLSWNRNMLVHTPLSPSPAMTVLTVSTHARLYCNVLGAIDALALSLHYLTYNINIYGLACFALSLLVVSSYLHFKPLLFLPRLLSILKGSMMASSP